MLAVNSSTINSMRPLAAAAVKNWAMRSAVLCTNKDLLNVYPPATPPHLEFCVDSFLIILALSQLRNCIDLL